jgi:hypothetical protein
MLRVEYCYSCGSEVERSEFTECKSCHAFFCEDCVSGDELYDQCDESAVQEEEVQTLCGSQSMPRCSSRALHRAGMCRSALPSILDRRASRWYVRPEPALVVEYLPRPHSTSPETPAVADALRWDTHAQSPYHSEVSRARDLDLDHLSTHAGQEHRAIWA